MRPSNHHDGKAVVTANISHLSPDQREVLDAYQAMQQAMVSADHDALRVIVEDGTIFTHMSGATQTKEEFISEVGGPLTYYHSDIRDIDVTIDGDWATVKGAVAPTANAYGTHGTLPLTINQDMHRVDGHWLYANRT